MYLEGVEFVANTFDNSVKEIILSFYDKVVDDEGFIVEKDDRTQRVLA